jgi:hypothetical protein
MTASDVPFAIAEGIPNKTIIAGTMIMPPPTPSMPARAPVAKPIAINTTITEIESMLRPSP